MSFENFPFHPKLLQAIQEAGYTTPTEIQTKAIPKILKGFDIRASAQTGTGKTGAFLLPALSILSAPSEIKAKGPRLLVLVPTRELAMQVSDQVKKYSKFLKKLKAVCIFGGVPYPSQMQKLKKPYDILIATPGRLIDFIQRKKISFGRLEMLVLDEADRMLDMGFLEPVETIVSKTPDTRQTLLFSATLDGSVKKLSEKLLKNPMDIVVHAKHEKHENIEQNLHLVDDNKHKVRLLDHILTNEDLDHTIIFASTKRHVDRLVKDLYEKGHKTKALHGDISQRQRTKTIAQFREGKFQTLIATDVASRGIDVQMISLVINFDLPRNIEDYVHRIGRTGRAGSKGSALSFVANQDRSLLKRIEKFTGQPIEKIEIPGFEPQKKKKKKAIPRKKRFFKKPRKKSLKGKGKRA